MEGPTKKRIAYVGPVSIPEGGAAARRMLGIAQSIRDSGHEVIFGSGQMPPSGQQSPLDFFGFQVVSLGERTAEHLPGPIKQLIYLGMGRKTRDWLESLNPPPDAVILYSGYSPYLMRIGPWCRKRRIPFIFDAVEWYDPAQMPGGRFGPYRANFEYAMRVLCLKCDGVIAISSFLQRYFEGKQVETVRVPPTVDVAALPMSSEATNNPVTTIVYAGSPGKKDSFDTMLEAIMRLTDEGQSVEFKIAGVSEARVLASPALMSRGRKHVPASIKALGIIPQREAAKLVSEADFTVLIRPLKQYAQAGFPTKVVESLSVGTPVICNLTSDLGEHIVDGKNGLVCADQTLESLIAAFRRAILLKLPERNEMRVAAREHAERAFDYRNFAGPMAEFLNRCVGKSNNKSVG